MDRRHQLVIAAAALLLAPGVFGQTYQVGQYLGNLNDAGRFAYNTMGGAAQHAAYSPGATWSTLGNGARMAGTATATIGGRTVPLTLISRIPAPAIFNGLRAVAAMNPTTAAITLLGGLALNHWMTQSQVSWNPDPNTQLQQPFLIPETLGGYIWVGGYGNCRSFSAMDAIRCSLMAQHNITAAQLSNCSIDSQTQQNVVAGCVYVPTGTRLVGGASSEYSESTGEKKATWEEAQPLMSSGTADYSAVNWKGITEQLLRNGGSVDPSQITSTVSGPASQQGQRTERTLSNGDKQVTQTTHNYTYNNSSNSSSVTHNTTTTNITTNINNEVVNETTETTENQPPPEEPGPDLCEKNPDILACQKVVLKDVEAKEVPNENKPLAITPDDGWNMGAATCPQPKTATVMGVQLSMPYTGLCDFATAIKPLLVGFAWLSAAFTFFGFAKRD